MSYDVEQPRSCKIFTGFLMPVMLCNSKSNEVCFKVAYFPFKITNTISELNQQNKYTFLTCFSIIKTFHTKL